MNIADDFPAIAQRLRELTKSAPLLELPEGVEIFLGGPDVKHRAFYRARTIYIVEQGWRPARLVLVKFRDTASIREDIHRTLVALLPFCPSAMQSNADIIMNDTDRDYLVRILQQRARVSA